jgi:hypothetical protein
MAVVQISRIQQRRGKKLEGTGLPQLASGELAWCVDSQELYIGNGSVSEGAPSVGNTKLLTYKDLDNNPDLLNIFQRVYKDNNTNIHTGIDSNHPVYRTVQDRLDDYVSTKDFGVIGDGIVDDTISLQRAIDQLFLNTAGTAYNNSYKRITLKIPAGTYKITGTLFIPSYATIIGEGSSKTIISHTSATPVVRFVNDLSTPGNPAGMGSRLIDTNLDGNFTNDSNDVQYTNQPRYILFKGLSIITSSIDQVALQLESVRDSTFEDLNLQGGWVGDITKLSKGIALYGFTSLVTCERNIFKNIYISGFNYGVYSDNDIINNLFDEGYVTNVKQGFVLGFNSDGVNIGQQFGSRDTIINNYKFYSVQQNAIFIDLGTGNNVSNIELYNVGNNFGNVNNQEFPQIYSRYYGNVINNIKSDRTAISSHPSLTYAYIPEVSGHCEYSSFGTTRVSLGYNTYSTDLFRLPLAGSVDGVPDGSITYNIKYYYKNLNNETRAGVLSIVVDIDAKHIQLTDEYNCTGTIDNSLLLDFQVSFLDINGGVLDNGEDPYSLSIAYTNLLTNDAGYLHYTYTAIS